MELDNILTIVTIILGIVQFIGVFAYKTLNDKCEKLEVRLIATDEKIEEHKEQLRNDLKEQNEKILASLEVIKSSINDIKIDIARNYVDYDIFAKTLREFPCRTMGFPLNKCPNSSEK